MNTHRMNSSSSFNSRNRISGSISRVFINHNNSVC